MILQLQGLILLKALLEIILCQIISLLLMFLVHLEVLLETLDLGIVVHLFQLQQQLVVHMRRLLRDLDIDLLFAEELLVLAQHGLARVLVLFICNEGDAPQAARVVVCGQSARNYGTVLDKNILDFVAGGIFGNVRDEDRVLAD